MVAGASAYASGEGCTATTSTSDDGDGDGALSRRTHKNDGPMLGGGVHIQSLKCITTPLPFMLANTF